MSEKGFFNRSLYELWKDRQAADTAFATSSMNSKMKKMAEQNEELIELMKENAGKMQAEAALKQEENAKEIKRLREELDKIKDNSPKGKMEKLIKSAAPVLKIELSFRRYFNVVATAWDSGNNLYFYGFITDNGIVKNVVKQPAILNPDGSGSVSIFEEDEPITANEMKRLFAAPVSIILNEKIGVKKAGHDIKVNDVTAPIMKIEFSQRQLFVLAGFMQSGLLCLIVDYLENGREPIRQVELARIKDDGTALLTIDENDKYLFTAEEVRTILESHNSKIAAEFAKDESPNTDDQQSKMQLIEIPEAEEDRIPIFEEEISAKLGITKVVLKNDVMWEVTGYRRIKGQPDEYFCSSIPNFEGNDVILTMKSVISQELLAELSEKTKEKYSKGTKTVSNTQNGQYIYKMLKYLRDNDVLYDTKGVERIQARKKGKVNTLDEHVKAMVYSLLSAETPWERIEPNLDVIDSIFGNYDPEFVKNQNPEKFVEEIRAISCGNRNIKRQMEALKYNIEVFEKLEDKYGSMDACINELGFGKVVNMLSDYASEYKLKMMHVALVSEYLRWMGVDGAKPDRHLCRFLGSARMGAANVSAEATPDEVFAQIDELAEETGLYKIEIDNIIWSFCADGYGEVCTATPHCEKCPIREFCKYKG